MNGWDNFFNSARHSTLLLGLSGNLQWILLGGSAVLILTLMILAMTRWGHARPVFKCVILSVAAHLLLLVYFYGTQLIFQYPSIDRGDTVSVKLIEMEESQDEIVELADQATPEPWESNLEQPLPAMDQMSRPELDSELELDRPDSVSTEPQSLVAQELDKPTEAAQDFSEPSDIDVQSVAARTPDSSSTVEPAPANFQRRGENPDELEASAPDFSAGEVMLEDLQITNRPNPERTRPNLVAPAERSSEQTPPMQLPQSSSKPDPNVFQSASSNPGFRTPSNGSARPIAKPRRLGDGAAIPRLYSLRMSGDLVRMAEIRGGSQDTQQAVNRALEWLANNQSAGGQWDPMRFGAGQENRILGHDRNGAGAQADTGITALATLALLGAGNTHLEGKYQLQVQHALEYLIRSQRPDGNLSGDARLYARMYCHSMALLALSEALAVTGDDRLAQAVRRGVEYTVRSQSVMDGGWRYQPGDRGDMSQFGWQVMALHGASIGGVRIPDRTVDRMHSFLDLCTSGVSGGLASYRPGQPVSTSMTAEALLCRFFMKKTVPPALIAEAQNLVLSDKPRAGRVNLYYWYYATLAMYHAGGEPWQTWNQALTSTLLPIQIQSGPERGSWPPVGRWAGYGGRVYSTAMAALCLEVYYRYQPVSEIAADE